MRHGKMLNNAGFRLARMDRMEAGEFVVALATTALQDGDAREMKILLRECFEDS